MPTDALAPEAPQTYSGEEGIRKAAADVAEARGGIEDTTPVKVEVDLPEEGVTADKAAEALSKYRQQQAEQRATYEKALGLYEPEPESAPTESTLSEREHALLDEYNKLEQRATAEAQQRQVYEQALQSSANVQALQFAQAQISSEFQQQFPDVRTEADFHALATTNPERYNAALSYLNAYQQTANDHRAWSEYQAQLQHHHFNTWAKSQDELFESRHPELKDPKAAAELSKLAINELKSSGLSEDEITALYHGQSGISLRSAVAQDILLDAVKFRHAKRNLKMGRRPAPPHVQRPGTAGSGRNNSALEAARAAMERRPNVDNAVKLMQAKRAARR